MKPKHDKTKNNITKQNNEKTITIHDKTNSMRQSSGKNQNKREQQESGNIRKQSITMKTLKHRNELGNTLYIYQKLINHKTQEEK